MNVKHFLVANLLLQPALLTLVYLCIELGATTSVHSVAGVENTAYALATAFAVLCFVVVRAAALDAKGE